MAGYCTHCGGSGFRRPSKDKALESFSPYARRVILAGEEATARELERLQAVIREERRGRGV